MQISARRFVAGALPLAYGSDGVSVLTFAKKGREEGKNLHAAMLE
jgi:hypothetical protein